jgi:hypothetical protein
MDSEVADDAVCLTLHAICYLLTYTVRSESRYAFRLRYVGLVVSIEVAVEVCFCFIVLLLNSG